MISVHVGASQKTGHWSTIGPFHEDGVQVPCRSQRRTWKHRLRGDFSCAWVAFQSLKLSGFSCDPSTNNHFSDPLKVFDVTNIYFKKTSRMQWFSFLLGVLHVFALSLTVYLEQEERKTTNKQSVLDNPRKRSGKQTKQESNKNETINKNKTCKKTLGVYSRVQCLFVLFASFVFSPHIVRVFWKKQGFAHQNSIGFRVSKILRHDRGHDTHR